MRPLPIVRMLLAALAMALGVGAALRLALALELLPAESWAWPLPWLMVRGTLGDLAAWSAALAVPAALGCISSLRWGHPRAARVTLASIGGALAFLAVIEWYFAEEFSARFNHIAVDYLLYPTEVAGNLWQGYPVLPWLAACALVGAALAWPLTPFVVRGADDAPGGWRTRSSQALFCLTVGALGLGWCAADPLARGGDRLEREVAGNGQTGFVRALWTSHLEYEAFYATLPRERIESALERARGPAGKGVPLARRPEQVVILIEESLGQEFVGALGGERACTPQLDRWSQRGLLFTNSIATGNRTVRGLEGILASFPPLPPDSIVKRSGAADFPTLGRCFRDAGYATAFFYGGVASFDHMGTWFAANGWDEIIDDGWIGPSPFPPDAFRTAWGVADGPALELLLERQVAEHAAGRPFFATALTVSNHKPFLVPEPFGEPARVPLPKRLRLLAVGLVALLLVGMGWWRGRGVLGVPALVALTLFVSLGYATLLQLEATAKGRRNDAVRYADAALGAYLDGLESRGLLDTTLVLLVGDHGARVYGAADIPIASYRVPALFVGAGIEPGTRIERLCSQIDLAPTLLELCGLPIPAEFFGCSQIALPATGGRAVLQHNRDIALLDDPRGAALGLGRTKTLYERRGDELLPLERGDPDGEALLEACQALFQAASNRLSVQDAPELARADGTRRR